MTQPVVKKRKLEPVSAKEAAEQKSFAEILAQLEAEEDGGGCESQLAGPNQHDANIRPFTASIETSASWPRPDLPKINPAVDSVGKCLTLLPQAFCE